VVKAHRERFESEPKKVKLRGHSSDTLDDEGELVALRVLGRTGPLDPDSPNLLLMSLPRIHPSLKRTEYTEYAVLTYQADRKS
jgi:hypothetical protein